MRAAGMTLQAIGDEFGVTRERIRQLVGSPNVTQRCEVCGSEFQTGRVDKRFCSRRCSQRGWAENGKHPCPDCGVSIGHRSVRCVNCRLTHFETERIALWTRIRELWNDGLPVNQIAERVGYRNANVLSVVMARMKHAGWELPVRRRGWRGYTRPPGPEPCEAPPRTPLEARRRYATATRNGTLIRPSRCERCDAEGFVDGHHPDLMADPLDVEWLCRSCHMAHHHGQEREAA